MFDNTSFEVMPKFNEFTYWFTKTLSGDGIEYDVIKLDEYDTTGHLKNPEAAYFSDKFTATDNVSTKPYAADFEKFKLRPEYNVGLKTRINLESVQKNSVQELITWYEMLLVGVRFLRAYEKHQNPDNSFMNFQEHCLKWIRSTDFYEAPSSTMFHDSCPAGLLFHSLKVYDLMIELRRTTEVFQDINYDSIVLTALMHDFCKIYLYESYLKNVKNDKTGQWEQVTAYKHNQKGVPLGHGATSVFLANKFFNLSVEEALAIRWHMGWFDISDSEKNEYALACDTYPLVELIQFADQLSVRPYAIK